VEGKKQGIFHIFGNKNKKTACGDDFLRFSQKNLLDPGVSHV